MMMTEEIRLTPELLEKTRRRAARRWTVQKGLVGAGSAVLCAALLLGGWRCWGGNTYPDTITSPQPAAEATPAADQTASPEDLQWPYTDLRIVPLRGTAVPESLRPLNGEGVVCLELGVGQTLEKLAGYGLTLDPLTPPGLNLDDADSRSCWLVLLFSESSEFLYAPDGITVTDSGDGGLAVEGFFRGPGALAGENAAAVQGFLLMTSPQNVSGSVTVTARYSATDEPLARPDETVAGDSRAAYFLDALLTESAACGSDDPQAYLDAGRLVWSAMTYYCGDGLCQSLTRLYAAELAENGESLRARVIAALYTRLEGRAIEPEPTAAPLGEDLTSVTDLLYGDLDRSDPDDAVTWSLIYDQGLDLTQAVPFVSWETVYETQAGNRLQRMIMVTMAGCGPQGVSWTEQDFYYMAFKSVDGQWAPLDICSISLFDPAAMGLDDEWTDNAIPKCELLRAAGELSSQTAKVRDAVIQFNKSTGMTLALPFEAPEPAASSDPLEAARNLQLDALRTGALEDSVTAAINADPAGIFGYTPSDYAECSSNRLNATAWYEFGREESDGAVTVYLWAHTVMISFQEDDGSLTYGSMGTPMKITLTDEKDDPSGFMTVTGWWAAEDGEGYGDSIRDNFGPYADAALHFHETDAYAGLKTQADAIAAGLLAQAGLEMPSIG